MAKARAASARGRSWLARTGGPLAGLDENIDHPELGQAKSGAQAAAQTTKEALEKTKEDVEKKTRR